ncbi:hypothetical protein [Salinicoccus sp. HZC-1]|uniref:hypothetical protein n=1 Tax=Salinicoccus sp. HZC-1 TaxID=3385497 RepID=UPI00398B361A
MQRDSEWNITRRELDREAEKPPQMQDSWKKDTWYSIMFEAFFGTVSLIIRFLRGIFSSI